MSNEMNKYIRNILFGLTVFTIILAANSTAGATTCTSVTLIVKTGSQTINPNGGPGAGIGAGGGTHNTIDVTSPVPSGCSWTLTITSGSDWLTFNAPVSPNTNTSWSGTGATTQPIVLSTTPYLVDPFESRRDAVISAPGYGGNGFDISVSPPCQYHLINLTMNSQLNQTPVPLLPDRFAHPAPSGDGVYSIDVLTDVGCPFTINTSVFSTQKWLTISLSGTDTGATSVTVNDPSASGRDSTTTIYFFAKENDEGKQRIGQFNVFKPLTPPELMDSKQIFQPTCLVTLNPTGPFNVDASGKINGSNPPQISVTVPGSDPGCTWAVVLNNDPNLTEGIAVTGADSLTLPGVANSFFLNPSDFTISPTPVNGVSTGNGSVQFTVPPACSTVSRSETFFIGSDPFTVKQAGDPNNAYGDIDGDGKVTVADLVLLENFVAGNITFTSTQRHNGDVSDDGTGQITISDVVTLANYIAGNIHCLPVINH